MYRAARERRRNISLGPGPIEERRDFCSAEIFCWPEVGCRLRRRLSAAEDYNPGELTLTGSQPSGFPAKTCRAHYSLAVAGTSITYWSYRDRTVTVKL